MRRLVRGSIVLVALLAVTAGAGAVWVSTELRGSLPALDGTVRLPGLTAPVAVRRDGLGIPTIEGASRQDVARATGFLHAQDRFFQMDLARRRAAGELAALVGPRALAVDREIRLHRFRAIARDAVARLSVEDAALLDAYAAGVNAGLATLGAVPFEYLALRQQPAPWVAEDSLLVVLSMFVTLQDTDGSHEAMMATMHDVLPREMFELMAPPGTEWDAPLVGEAFTVPAIPGPEVYDLRGRRPVSTGMPMAALPSTLPRPLASFHVTERLREQIVRVFDPAADCAACPRDGLTMGATGTRVARPDRAAVGSNNWAVAGRLAAGGGALVANDMHLSVRVPNTWYRTSLVWPDPSQPSARHTVTGVTLPGVPAIVVGSNTHVAWGFTNTYADWGDIVLLELDPDEPKRYRTPDGWRELAEHVETIEIAGQPSQQHTVTWSIWGPVLGPDHRGRPRAYRWVAHAADRLAQALTPIETARTIEEAFDQANRVGAPGQNMVVAERTGRIGWSIYGSLPRRVGITGELPASWADGASGWDGWFEPQEFPRIVDPPDGRIWTANNRVVDGDGLRKMGDGGYEVGARARIIRDRLTSSAHFSARDLLAIQLDTRADFLARWRDLLVATLTARATDGHALRRQFRDLLEQGWSGMAAPDSAAYGLTRRFRDVVSERVIAFVLAECYERDPAFDYSTMRRREGAIWKVISERPLHLLDPRYETWEEFLLAAADAVIEQSRERGGDLRQRVWAEYNVTAYHHPLSGALPLVGRWLDMPHHPLPGDLYTPRMHWGSAAASQRMVVSPGREHEGIMHMPTGQSGHPLSPFYANSHDAWVNGDPTPFMPGETIHTLTLVP